MNSEDSSQTSGLAGKAASPRRLTIDGIWILTGQFVTIPMKLASAVLTVRLLGAAGYGSYVLIISVASVLSLVSRLGVETVLVKELAARLTANQRADLRAPVVAGLRTVLIASLVAASFLALPPGRWALDSLFGAGDLSDRMLLLSAVAIGSSVQVVVAQAFRGTHNQPLATLIASLLPTASRLAALTVAYVAGGGLSLDGALWIAAAASGVTAVGGGFVLLRHLASLGGPADDFVSTTPMIWVGIPMMLGALLRLVIGTAPVWALGSRSTPDELAWYAVAASLALLLGIPGGTVGALMTPVIPSMAGHGHNAAIKLRLTRVVALSTAAVLAAFAALLVASEFVLDLYGPEAGGAFKPMVILGIGWTFATVAGPCSLALNLTGHERLDLAATAGSAIVTVVLAFGLAKSHGAIGVAIAHTVGLSLQNLVAAMLAKRHLGIQTFAGWPRIGEITR